MQRFDLFARVDSPGRVLALGAHCDDIEIGCGGTLLELAAQRPRLEVTWVVFCSTAERAAEARASARDFLRGVPRAEVVVHAFRDGFLPWSGPAVKEAFEALKKSVASPDVIFTHQRDDRHQDHRLVSELTWNTWRQHLILEYEIPKYDGDLGHPNFFSPLKPEVLDEKVKLLFEHFPSQAGRGWFTADLFRGLARLRGVESGGRELFAEAFHCRKALF